MKWVEPAAIFGMAAVIAVLGWFVAKEAHDPTRVVGHELWDGRLICIQRTPQEDGQ